VCREAELSAKVPGYDVLLSKKVERTKDLSYALYEPPVSPVLQGLSRLSKERQLVSLAVNNSFGTLLDSQAITIPLRTRPKAPEALADASLFDHPEQLCSLERPVLVIIRHGKTEHNKLGLFTGWEDAHLAKEGRQEAVNAGRLLRAHGIEFDVVYTSWLSRAIETAWIVLDQLDSLWLPIIKSWRLNERMYGALTGMSKDMIRQKHGSTQFKLWRRSYDKRPPAISSFSTHYPGNDERYINNVKDIRYSIFESLIRTIAHRKMEVHRKFPKTESLKDCMDRTIPYYKDVIVPDSIDKGKNVLIASSENAIRGLLMHLCDIPSERISEVEIPTGLPLVYNSEKRCIQVLEDGIDQDPLSRYNFGSSPDLLFKPCDLDNDNEVCYLGKDGKSYQFNPIIEFKTGKMIDG
jgi:2,3-bisphosphoglycerate-dependent phosphoglycerate mutase